MIGSTEDSNTPDPSAWWAKAATSAPMRSAVVFGRSKATAGAAFDTLTCMMVRVLGP